MNVRLLAKQDRRGHCVKQEHTAEDVPPDHRITERFGSEGTFKGHLIQPLCNEEQHLQQDQVELAGVAFCGLFLHFL